MKMHLAPFAAKPSIYIEQRKIFKTATLIYKYPNTGFPKHFSPYLSLYKQYIKAIEVKHIKSHTM